MNSTVATLYKRTINFACEKPYEVFFIILALVILSPIITMMIPMLMASQDIPLFWNIVILYVGLLLSLGVMIGLGEAEITAKDFFWLWVTLSVAFTALAGFGYLEIIFIHWFSN